MSKYRSPLLKEIDKLSTGDKLMQGLNAAVKLALIIGLAFYVWLASDPWVVAYVALLSRSVQDVVSYGVLIGSLNYGVKFELFPQIFNLTLRVFCWYVLLDQAWVLQELMAR